MEVGSGSNQGTCCFQEPTHLWKVPHALWFIPQAYSHLWCLSIRSMSSVVTQDTRRLGETNRLYSSCTLNVAECKYSRMEKEGLVCIFGIKKNHNWRHNEFRLAKVLFTHRVIPQDFGAGSKWLPAKVVETFDPVSFHVLLEDGRHKRCHQDQLRPIVVGMGNRDVPDSTEQGCSNLSPYFSRISCWGPSCGNSTRSRIRSTITFWANTVIYSNFIIWFRYAPIHVVKESLENGLNQEKTETDFFVWVLLCM